MSLLTTLGKLLHRPSARLVASTSILDGDQVIMVREGSAHKRGEWNLPSGRVDRGESVTAAAVREAKEETGLDIRLMAIAGIYIYRSGSGDDVVRFNFRAEPTGGTPHADGREILEVRWMFFPDILAMPNRELRAPSTLRSIIADLVAGQAWPLGILHDENL